MLWTCLPPHQLRDLKEIAAWPRAIIGRKRSADSSRHEFDRLTIGHADGGTPVRNCA